METKLQTLIDLNQQTIIQQSRSFAIPILKLEPPLQIPIMVQYNLNKTIDTIEDNPLLAIDKKIYYINQFCHALESLEIYNEISQKLLDKTTPDEAYVFKNYQATIDLLKTLSKDEQDLAIKWTLEMAKGMCLYLEKPIQTPTDLNDYCYYVAGTVGLYLTQLLQLHCDTIKPQMFSDLETNATHFGLFLQKLNIIRDFNEDATENNRQFWPQDYFQQNLNRQEILNKLCLETLSDDVPKALNYLIALPNEHQSYEYFIRFIMASGLKYLKLLINNQDVFAANKVKLPKLLIKSLYNKVTKIPRSAFHEYCQDLYEHCLRNIHEITCAN